MKRRRWRFVLSTKRLYEGGHRIPFWTKLGYLRITEQVDWHTPTRNIFFINLQTTSYVCIMPTEGA